MKRFPNVESIHFLLFGCFSSSSVALSVFLLLSIPFLSTRIVPLRFQAEGRRKRPNLGLVCSFLANVNSCSCSLYVVVSPSVVCRLSVTFVHPTQPIEIFGNVSAPCNTLVT